MITQEDLKIIRERGYSDDEIWSKLAETNSDFSTVKERGYSLEEVASITSGKPMPEPEPVGTSIGQEISQIPAALKQSFGQPLEAMGETAQVAGFPAVATALKGAIQEPEGYVSAGQRFMEPQEGEFQVAGFAPQYAPRAVVEQTGQIVGSIGSRIAGAVTLGGLGAMINPGVGAAGVATGLFAGPALFEAAQIVGPVALERAKNNGYAEPTDKDMAYAIATAAGSGLLNAFGAKYLPGGEKAVGSFAKRLAASFIGEGVPEGLQSFTQQVGETIETQKGIQVNPKQAVGEALIGGGAGAVATTIAAPFTPEQIEEAKITESANKEAENLVIGNDNPQGKAVLANKQKLEQEIADTKQVLQAIESTDPVAQKLKLELKEKEAILAAAQGQVDNIVESTNPIAEAKKQQIELGKQIAEKPVEVVPEVTPQVTEVITPPTEVAPEVIPPVTEVTPTTEIATTTEVVPEVVTPTETKATEITPTVTETLPVAPIEEAVTTEAPAGVTKENFTQQKEAIKVLNELTTIDRAALSGRLLSQGLITRAEALYNLQQASNEGITSQQISTARLDAEQKWDDRTRDGILAGRASVKPTASADIAIQAENARRGKRIVSRLDALNPKTVIGMTARRALKYASELNIITPSDVKDKDAIWRTGTVVKPNYALMQDAAAIIAEQDIPILDREKIVSLSSRGRRGRAVRFWIGDIGLPSTKNTNVQTLVHEVGHTLTVDKIREVAKRDQSGGRDYIVLLRKQIADTKIDEPVRRLMGLYISTIEQLGIMDQYGKVGGLAGTSNADSSVNAARKLQAEGKLRKDLDASQLYALANLEEFVAQTFSSPQFRDLLKTLKDPNTKKSIWREFVQAIKDLFGFTSDSMAAAVIEVTFDIAKPTTVEEALIANKDLIVGNAIAAGINPEDAEFVADEIITETIDATYAAIDLNKAIDLANGEIFQRVVSKYLPKQKEVTPATPTPAVSETITEPESDTRYNPLGYDIADVVEDIKQGKTSTPLKAVNQVIKESTDLRKRVAAESTRRQQPRKMGKAAILERIARERSAGNINENTAKALTDFINRVNDDAIWDTAISIRAKGVSNFDFGDNLVTFFLNQDKGDFGASVGIHEFWHGLSRFLPDAEVEKINNDYTKELADYLKKNPWFLAFVGRYSLTPEQFEAYKFFNPKEAETKLTPVKDEQGNIVKYKIKFDKDNYRYIMLDEFIAEKMTDLVLGKQQEPNTFLGKLAKVLREFMALIKARLGIAPYEKFYQAVTSTNGKLVLQRETGVAPAMQIYDPVEYDYSTRKMGADLKSIRPRTPEENTAFEKASSNKVMARNPELAVAAVRLNNGEITAGEYADLIDALNPFIVKGAESIPTKSKINQYIDEGKKDKVNAPIENGKEVEFRIDIPTYNRSTAAGDTVYAVTAHEPVPETSKRVGTPISYVGVAKVINPKMMTRSISGKGEAIDIATGAGKFPLATVKGNYEPITELPADINDPNVWTEVSYNPIRSSYFVDVRSKNAVVAGDEAIMVGSRVFVKNPKMEARPRGLIGPEKRYMATEPEQGDAPIKPEAKTVTEGLVQGIDIGKENNMPINNKIESHIKNFAFVRGIFESASDRLRRAKFTKLATAIDDYYDQAQRRLGFANKILLPAFEEYSKQSKATKAKIDEEVKMFFAAQENKRDTAEFFDELNPITQNIVTAWQKFGEESGKENQRIGIKVYDKGLQRWRPIGRIEKFWPRVLKPEYKRALMEPDKYQKEYNEIVEALMKSGRINTPEEAEVFISEYQGTGSQNDYFSGIEAARGQAFPEELYDYSTQVMTDYVARWAQHSSRIEQFGQKLGENSKTLWDRSRESTRDRRTIDYITAAQERVEGYFPNDPFVKGMSTLGIWTSGFQLGNFSSSMLNFFGGTTLNAMVGQPGAFSSYLSSFIELRNLGRQLKDAREKGIVSRDLMNIIGDHQAMLEYNRFAQAGQKTTDFLLKYSGFTPVEQMVRTQSMIIGKSFLRKTLSSLSKNPNSSFSKRSLAWLNRNNIDADKLIVEQGTGPETDKLLRYFANISQGSYTIAQTPIFIDTPIGRFLFKYQKFSTQMMRQSWKNTFEPAWKAVTNKNETLQLPEPTRQLLYRLRLAEAKELGDNRKITLDEIPKKVTKAEGKALTIIPVMMWLGAAYVGGEVILRMRDIIFGVLMKGPSYEDIIKAFEDDEDDDELYLSLERAWYNLIGMGALGLIGNYAQFFMDWQDRERVKNPLDPPALSIVKETGTFFQNFVDQGKITLGDINDYLNRTLSAYRVAQRAYQTAASGLEFSKAPTVAEEMFRRETASINKYARRWAESAGLEYRTRRPSDLPTSKMTPINRKIASYLQRGEPGAAVAYAKEYLNSIPKKEREKAIQSMESGARNRKPFRLGNGPMNESEKTAFKKWLKEKVSKEDFDKFQKLDSSYQKTYNLFLSGLPNK
jgi:hypothetical protein